MDAELVSPESAVSQTRAWLEAAVIGLNLCPFAKAVYVKNQVRIVASTARHGDDWLDELEAELRLLNETSPDLIDTTLMVHPRLFADFLDFNDFLDHAESVLDELDLQGVIQIAPFHPQFLFADAPADDISHATNRSPFTTMHLLREASIDKAVEAFPEAETIFEANIATLNQLGIEGWGKLSKAWRN